MLGWTPANIRIAIPSPMAETPSVVMNDGTFSAMSSTPLRHPSAAPRAIAITMPRKPRSLPLRLFSTSSATAMAEAAITPLADRSIEPISSTNVAPQVTTARTEAASRMFWKLPSVRNCELSSEKTITITTRAIGGPASRKDTPRRGWGRAATTSAGDVTVTTADLPHG